MTTYVYETIPQKTGEKPLRFEVQQSMQEKPLAKHPKTGKLVRRIIAGGYGFIAQKSVPPVGPCGSPCESQCECLGAN